jgi:hypothetical protein
VIAQGVDLCVLDVGGVVEVFSGLEKGDRGRWWLPIRLGDGEVDLLGDVTRVATPSPQVEGPCALTSSCLLFQVVHRTAFAQCL